MQRAFTMPLMIAVVTVLYQPPAKALGSRTEICVNAVDDDNDGTTDEGCDCYTHPVGVDIPWQLDTSREFRHSTNARTKYGNYAQHLWHILANPNLWAVRAKVNRLDVEACCDYLRFNNYKFKGQTLPVDGYSYDWEYTGNMTPMQWFTDYSEEFSGARISELRIRCNAGGFTHTAIPWVVLNRGFDGVLMHPQDDVYFRFSLPAGREAVVVLDTRSHTDLTFGGPERNFNVYLREDDGLFPHFASESHFSGTLLRTDGEVVHVPAVSRNRTFITTVHAATGRGRFRVIVASPTTSFSQDVDIAFEASYPVGSGYDWQGKEVWARARAKFLGLTDGQYWVRKEAIIHHGSSCTTCYDVYMAEENLEDCIPASTGFLPFIGSYIYMSRSTWKMESPFIAPDSDSDGTETCIPYTALGQVALTMAHEWAHREFWLCDEYGDTASIFCHPAGDPVPRCGFTVMSGSSDFGYLEGNSINYEELCTPYDHGKDGATDQDPATGDSGWTDVNQTRPQIALPVNNESPDVTQMYALQRQMVNAPFSAFTDVF